MKKRQYAFGIDKLINEAPVESAGAITNLIPVLASAISTITNANNTVQYPITQPQQMSSFAMGGTVQSQVPINVEGGEIMKAPNGQQVEMEGVKHEQGGIDTVAPEGTTIYSDRLKVNGKTLADRQKLRTNKELKLSKLLKGNEYDAIHKNTLQRVQAQNRQEDGKDKQMMAFVNQMEDNLSTIDTFMNGGMVKAKQYANGTPYVDFYGNDDELYQYDSINNKYNKRQYNADNKQYGWESFTPDKTFINNHLTSNYNDGVPIGTLGKLQGQSDNFDATTYIPRNDLKGYREHNDLLSNQAAPELSLTNNSGKQYTLANLIRPDAPTNVNNSVVPTSTDIVPSSTEPTNTDTPIGNKLGAISSIFSGVAPLATTIANRAGDKANTNFFKTVGTRALGQLDKVEANIGSQQQLAERENQLLTNTMSIHNRNNAGDVNTLRTLDSASTTQLADNNSKIVSNFLQQLSSVGGQKAQIMQQSDTQIAGAETQREENDKKDRDNYYTNLGRNLNNIGTVGQTQAKMMNETQLGKDQLDVMSQMSAYGLTFKRVGGKLQLVNDKSK